MTRTIRRRIEALEKSFPRPPVIFDDNTRANFITELVLAYHIGEIKIDESPCEGFARALNYKNVGEQVADMVYSRPEVVKRYRDALRRLFAQVGLDLERSPATAKNEAYAKLVAQVPRHWVEAVEAAHSVEELSRLWTPARWKEETDPSYYRKGVMEAEKGE
jgi:hypothetical protein